MSASVLIVTESGDLHADAVAAVLRDREGMRVATWDLRTVPARGCTFGVASGAVHAVTAGTPDVPLDDVACVWWRRPGRVPMQAGPDATMERFRADETDALTHGVLWSHAATWVNDPARERIAKEKLVQLAAAATCGLDVPDTIVTNEPHAARAFLDRVAPARVVMKRVSATPGVFVETRLVGDAERARLDALRTCPAILQVYVDGVADVRLTWMAGDIRCVRIDSPAGSGRVDSRLDLSVAFVAHEIPPGVARGLGALMHALGLVFGVIDMRLDAAGRYWFLEVNPQGQFAYLELKSGLPFVEPFARFLARCARGEAPGPLSTSLPTELPAALPAAVPRATVARGRVSAGGPGAGPSTAPGAGPGAGPEGPRDYERP